MNVTIVIVEVDGAMVGKVFRSWMDAHKYASDMRRNDGYAVTVLPSTITA